MEKFPVMEFMWWKTDKDTRGSSKTSSNMDSGNKNFPTETGTQANMFKENLMGLVSTHGKLE